MAKPLIEAGWQKITKACDRYALVAHDWAQLMYKEHTAKRDRIMLSNKHVPEGYELQTALLLSDRDAQKDDGTQLMFRQFFKFSGPSTASLAMET